MMKWLLITLVKGYQTFISAPLHALGGPGSGCRYTPTCSQYFIQAVHIHGATPFNLIRLNILCRFQLPV